MRTKGRTIAVLGTIILVLVALVLTPTSFASCSAGVEENEDVVVDPTATSTSTPIPEPTQTPTPTTIATPTPRTISFLDEAADAGMKRLVVGGASDYVVGASFILNFGKESQELIKIVELGFERRPNRGVHILTLSTPLVYAHANGEGVSEVLVYEPNPTSTPYPHQVPAISSPKSLVPSVPQVPDNVTFKFDLSTTQEDQNAIRLGIELAYRMYTEVLGKYPKPMTFTTLTSGCNGAVASIIGQDLICLNILHPGWKSRSYDQKIKTGPHEYFHNLQHTIGCDVGWDSGLDAVWLGEGSADFYAYWVLSESGFGSLHKTLEDFKKPLRVIDVASLSELESHTPNQWQSLYWNQSVLAVDYLVSKTDLHSYIGFCELRSSGIPWKVAFHQAFGLTVPEFYEQFELYRANGYK